ncbi:MAG: Tar ligand binding domain-containing protein, partial [Actinomycetota bacterium]|nr:Tar ligand binding domain-containing protein [Actinomycetota bacterium]
MASLGAVLLLLMTVVVGLGVLSLTSIHRDFETFAEEDFPAFNHLLHVDRDLFRAQHAAQLTFLTDAPDERSATIAEMWSQVERTDGRWSSYLAVAHGSTAELALQDEYAMHREMWLDLVVQLTLLGREGRGPDDAEVGLVLRDAEAHFQAARSIVHELEEDFYEPLVENGTDAGSFDARLLLIALLGGGLFVGGLASVTAVRLTKRQYLALRRREMDERFRALVESAQDVITVVSGTDSLTVMSGDLGALKPVSVESE